MQLMSCIAGELQIELSNAGLDESSLDDLPSRALERIAATLIKDHIHKSKLPKAAALLVGKGFVPKSEIARVISEHNASNDPLNRLFDKLSAL